ncbi:hypothetical protein [Gymnodinialimonas ceratoperidinii]|uniref:Uncharacterized protein n=1 Tax=Gymnodinialimonas ceratoperidinii TaxID=2856823 RepID=A0A8F6YD65_9RHOB|nr:hypothetical protein [Gymnodinialimonas ceratoperidinii]QXT39877.1 hypothetical protein KYE46_01040 [Gymnodinialimonas ceratoperidinii]
MRILLGLCMAGLALVIVLGTSLDRLEPWFLSLGLQPDGYLAQGMFELVATLLIVPPLLGLFHAVGTLGTDRGEVDAAGRIILRHRAGARRLHVGLCAALVALFCAGAYFLTDPGDLVLRLISTLCAAGFFVAAYIIWSARILYDDTMVMVPRFCRAPRRLEWRDLSAVEWIAAQKHFELTFTQGRKITISSSYAGVHDLIALARRMVIENARTARS